MATRLLFLYRGIPIYPECTEMHLLQTSSVLGWRKTTSLSLEKKNKGVDRNGLIRKTYKSSFRGNLNSEVMKLARNCVFAIEEAGAVKTYNRSKRTQQDVGISLIPFQIMDTCRAHLTKY